MVIETHVVREIQQLTDTFQELNSLTDNPVAVELCTSEYWLSHWLACYPDPRDKIFVCCHRITTQFIAIYPLYLKKIAFGYELRFIGSGEPEHAEVCSEFQDFIINPAYLQQSLSLFSDQLKQLKHCYRICFNNVLADSNCYKWLKSFAVPGWQYREQCVGKRYLLPVATNELSQINLLPQGTLRRHARRFIERDDISVAYCQQQQDIPRFFDELIALHTIHWQQRGKPGAFSSEYFRRFHKNFASDMLGQDKLLLFKLNHNNTTIAVFYGFYHHHILYYYQSGINSASPLVNTGIALHLIAMRHARNKAIKFYDLMGGKFDSYKKTYAKPSEKIYNITSQSILFYILKNLLKISRHLRTKAKKLLLLYR